MKYPILFGLMAIAWFLIAVLRGGWWWIALWPAVSFALVAAAYGGCGVRVFAKQSNGRMSFWAVILLLPFLLMTWIVWHIQHLFDKNRSAEVLPGLWIGRRPLRSDLPNDATFIVDLTAEFPVAAGVYHSDRYLCCPMLDKSVPTTQVFGKLIDEISGREGTVYIHCAQGHGRSAMVTCALLLARGRASNIEQALEMIRQVRPRIGLAASQRKLLESWWDERNRVS